MSPLLSSYLQAPTLETSRELGRLGHSTELVVEVRGGAWGFQASRPAELWLVGLAPVGGNGESCRSAGAMASSPVAPAFLRGSRLIERRPVACGETIRWSIPPALFGEGVTLSAVLVSEGGWAAASVALPAADPSDPLLAPPEPGSIAINEFMKDPAAVSDARGEWLEVINPTDKAIDIEGWTLRDDGSNRTVLSAGGDGIVVPAGGFAVLGRSADPALNGGVPVDATYSGFTLANGDDQIVLEAPGGFLVDRVDYRDGGVEGWPEESGASLSLSPRFLGTSVANEGGAWCVGTAPLPSGDRGTPGEANPECP